MTAKKIKPLAVGMSVFAWIFSTDAMAACPHSICELTPVPAHSTAVVDSSNNCTGEWHQAYDLGECKTVAGSSKKCRCKPVVINVYVYSVPAAHDDCVEGDDTDMPNNAQRKILTPGQNGNPPTYEVKNGKENKDVNCSNS